MPRNNKVTERVFADIAETPIHKEAYVRFLFLDEELGMEESEQLKFMKRRYEELVAEVHGPISQLARVEEIIIQMRAKKVIDSELRLSLSRNYIYARSLFYRRDNQINDIRVIVGKISEYGDDLEKLMTNDMFRLICKKKLIEAMDREIEKNVEYLNLINEYKSI